MIDLYKIDGTSNNDPEQHRDRYMDSTFWPSFQDDLRKLKETLIEKNKNNKSLTVLRMGHAEHCLFNMLVPFPKKGSIITNRPIPRHYSKQQSYDTWIKCLESISESDYITTQIGDDFYNWIWDLIHYKNVYLKYKNDDDLRTLFSNLRLFSENYDVNEKYDFPLDIIYGLIANKWILKTFKNQIGFIGNENKLNVIKELIQYEEYQNYLETDYFLEYISIPQQRAIENENIENEIFERLKESTCKIFLVGAGVCKLKFFYKLKEIRPDGIFIDIGHGIDAIAGLADYNRPYFGSWQNYRLKDYNYNGIDFCGAPSWNNVIIL